MKTFVKDNINLFAAITEENRAASGKNKAALWLCITMAGLILFFVGISGALVFQNAKLLHEAATLESSIADPDFSAQYQEKLATQNSLNAYAQYNQSCTEYIEKLKAANRLGSGTFDQLHALLPAGAGISGYKFSENAMEITCSADNEDSPAAYAKALADSGLFPDVQFSGFTTGSKDGNGYSFSISCVLWEVDSSGGVETSTSVGTSASQAQVGGVS